MMKKIKFNIKLLYKKETAKNVANYELVLKTVPNINVNIFLIK